MKKVMVFAPHPDDETLGCGGTMLKHVDNGDEVILVIATEMKVGKFLAEKIICRMKEIEKVKELYKLSKLYELKFPTMEIDQIPKSKLVQKISKLIAGEKPNIIYLPYRGDVHSDHKIVFDSVVSASKSFRNNSIERILCYETISETDFSIDPDSNYFRPNVFVDISKYMRKKEEIISVYESEIGEHPFPRSVECIRALAVVRGGMSSFKFAEAFMLLKERLE